jgi:assimilatory nitrate reductase catalytic subunit
MRRFGYASCVPFGREREGLRLRLANAGPFTEADLAELSAAFEVEGMRTLRYDDSRRRISRRIAIADGRLAFVLLVGDDQSAGWLAQWMEAGTPIDAPGRLLLSGGAGAPGGAPIRGRIVCNCHDVSENEIEAALAADCNDDGNRDCGAGQDRAGARLQRLQRRLKCGTDCGSCLPELRRRIAVQRATTS